MDKEWTKIVKNKMTLDEIFAIDNLEHRRIADDNILQFDMKRNAWRLKLDLSDLAPMK